MIARRIVWTAVVMLGCSRGEQRRPSAAPLANAVPFGFRRCISNTKINAFAASPDGGVIIGGTFVDGADFGAGPQRSVGADKLIIRDDGFVAAFNARGGLRWFHALGTEGNDRVDAIVAHTDGSCLVSAATGAGEMDVGGHPIKGPSTFTVAYDAEGKVSSTHPLDTSVSVMASGSRGDIAIIGYVKDAPAVTVLSSAGEWQWTRKLPAAPNSSSPRLEDVAIDSQGHVVVSGSGGGSIDFGDGPHAPSGIGTGLFVASYRKDGEIAWTKYFASEGTNGPTSLAIDGHDRVHFVGGFQGHIDFGGGDTRSRQDDGFVVVYGPDGKHAWTSIITATGGAQLSDSALDAKGDTWVVGRYSGELDFAGKHIKSSEYYGTFSAVVGADGTPQALVDGEPTIAQDPFPRLQLVSGGKLLIVPGEADVCVVLAAL